MRVSATAAGNDNKNADLFSPARASTGVTVGATDKHDKRAFFSNHGPRVDVYAPGDGIQSTFINGLEVSRSFQHWSALKN
ncbi:hypothetical protein C0993_000774 [Termitomyces sp. T159_Od127]|nr:hypothetical protein C0993_000774 [Termitomyces sp. T159_Od127]